MVLDSRISDVAENQFLIGFNTNFFSCRQLQEAEIALFESVCGSNNNVANCANCCASVSVSCGGLGPVTGRLTVSSTDAGANDCAICINDATICKTVVENGTAFGYTKTLGDV